MITKNRFYIFLIFFINTTCVFGHSDEPKPRIRDIGVTIGVLAPGPLNAITDVAGVKIGHKTLIKNGTVCTGVTAILPHGGNLYNEKVPGAVFLGNAFGKLTGSTQVNELGEIETPILLTSSLSALKVADALISYMLNLPENKDVLSINPLVGETNDGYLNDIRARPIDQTDVFEAINNAKTGSVVEGNVGAGTGTIAFGFKGGIGTSSRQLPKQLGGYTVGVLVQTNFGGVLTIAGVPIGKELGQYYLRDYLEKPNTVNTRENKPDGSIMIVVATDAPLDHRNLNRLAARAMMGLARTGSSASNGSGDYVIAFSTAKESRIYTHSPKNQFKLINNEDMSPLFEAVIEATEESIYNSLFQAQDIVSSGHSIKALPIDKVVNLLKNYRPLKENKPSNFVTR